MWRSLQDMNQLGVIQRFMLFLIQSELQDTDSDNSDVKNPGERAAVLYSLVGTCRHNGVEPEAWLHYVLGNIQDWPVNQVNDLLPWNIDLTSI